MDRASLLRSVGVVRRTDFHAIADHLQTEIPDLWASIACMHIKGPSVVRYLATGASDTVQIDASIACIKQ